MPAWPKSAALDPGDRNEQHPGVAEESFQESPSTPFGCCLMAGTLQKCRLRGHRAGSQLGLLGRCVDLGWACLGITATLQTSFVLLLQSCWDCRWDAKALDALGGP